MVLESLIDHPERLNRDTLYELRTIVARYPYFQTARLLMLNNMYLLHDPDFGAELRRSVLYVYDRRALYRLIEGHSTNLLLLDEGVTAEQSTADRTLGLIDAFLSTLPEEWNTSTPLHIEPAGDYVSQYLLSDVSANPEHNSSSDMTLIDRFMTSGVARGDSAVVDSRTLQLLSETDGLPQFDVDAEESLDETYFTETLAKIYIKQRKYSRALEIIRSLYLKYPEKNVYFADQIRFLEKLIINNNSK